jgi:hypothetical protein
MISFSNRITVPGSVLFRELDGEAILLNLDTESYLGLDEVGTRMWTLLTTSPSIQAAYEALLGEYDVAPEALRNDLQMLLRKVVDHGLVELNDA